MCRRRDVRVDHPRDGIDSLELIGVDPDRPQLPIRTGHVAGRFEQPDARLARGVEDDIGPLLVQVAGSLAPAERVFETAAVVRAGGQVGRQDLDVGIHGPCSGLEARFERPDEVGVKTAEEADDAGLRFRGGRRPDQERTLLVGRREVGDVWCVVRERQDVVGVRVRPDHGLPVVQEGAGDDDESDSFFGQAAQFVRAIEACRRRDTCR